jgi:hypothetical protein
VLPFLRLLNPLFKNFIGGYYGGIACGGRHGDNMKTQREDGKGNGTADGFPPPETAARICEIKESRRLAV